MDTSNFTVSYPFSKIQRCEIIRHANGQSAITRFHFYPSPRTVANSVSTVANVLNRAIQSTAIKVDEARSRQDKDAPGSDRVQESAHDEDAVYRFVYRLLALPLEIRNMIYCYACYGSPTIKLPGLAINGIVSLMVALKDPQSRSRAIKDVWQTCHIEWVGSFNLVLWHKFKKTVIPHIRCLTINFKLTNAIWCDEDSEIRQTLAWMWKRGKPGNRARYSWNLEQLQLVGLEYEEEFKHDGPWWFAWHECPIPEWAPWYKHFSLTRLRDDGLKVTLQQKAGHRRMALPGRRAYCYYADYQLIKE